jgi:hypothetical protein
LLLKPFFSFQDNSNCLPETVVDDFSNLLDSLKRFPPWLCKLELVGMLRAVAKKIDEERSIPGKGSGPIRDPVKESLTSLWQRHLECHSASKKVEAEVDKWTERSDKAVDILKSNLSDQNPENNLIVHHLMLVRQTSCAEALLVKFRSQAAMLQSESQSQVRTD